MANKISEAIYLAAKTHLEQVDKGDEPYILHSLEVMRIAGELYQKDFEREEVLVTAVLHDVIEDFEGSKFERLTLLDVIESKFGPEVFEALIRLTKADHEPYDDYIERVSNNWIATIVKIADLTHNMDVTRLPSGEIKEYDFERWDKYRRSLVKLKGKYAKQ